jgi:hypothetical protein
MEISIIIIIFSNVDETGSDPGSDHPNRVNEPKLKPRTLDYHHIGDIHFEYTGGRGTG